MAATHYELIFSGELIENTDLAQARSNLGQLFKASDAQLDKLFSGQPIVLKNKLELPAGRKYLQALRKSGVIGRLYDMESKQEWIDPPLQASHSGEVASDNVQATPSDPFSNQSKPTTANPARSAAAAIGTASLQVELDTPDWDIAPAGTDMREENDQPPPPAPDTSHLSLRPQKGNLVDPQPKDVPPPPDTSHLKLTD